MFDFIVVKMVTSLVYVEWILADYTSKMFLTKHSYSKLQFIISLERNAEVICPLGEKLILKGNLEHSR